MNNQEIFFQQILHNKHYLYHKAIQLYELVRKFTSRFNALTDTLAFA